MITVSVSRSGSGLSLEASASGDSSSAVMLAAGGGAGSSAKSTTILSLRVWRTTPTSSSPMRAFCASALTSRSPSMNDTTKASSSLSERAFFVSDATTIGMPVRRPREKTRVGPSPPGTSGPQAAPVVTGQSFAVDASESPRRSDHSQRELTSRPARSHVASNRATVSPASCNRGSFFSVSGACVASPPSLSAREPSRRRSERRAVTSSFIEVST